MATASKVGRNERCPCGSGKKYKACCGLKKRGSRELSNFEWIVVAAFVVVVALVLTSIFRAASGDATTRTCPPGQSWSVAHGHCH